MFFCLKIDVDSYLNLDIKRILRPRNFYTRKIKMLEFEEILALSKESAQGDWIESNGRI